MKYLLLLVISFSYISCNETESTKSSQAKNKLELQEVMDATTLKQYAAENELQAVTLAGPVEVEYFDDLQAKKSITRYFLNNKEINILNSDDKEIHSGDEIKFESFTDNNKSYGIAEVLKQRVPLSIPIEKMLVLMIDFNNSSPPANSLGFPLVEPKTIAKHLNTGFFKDYFDQNFGKTVQNKVTKVEGWHRLDQNCQDTNYPGIPAATGYLNSNTLKDIVIERDIDHTQFDNITVIINCRRWTTWGVASSITFPDGHRVTTSSVIMGYEKLYLGSEEGMIPGYAFDPKDIENSKNIFLDMLLHERGHNFGVGHATALDCGSSNNLFPCETVTYGNPYSVMGHGHPALALSANTLNVKGYRNPSQFIQITESGIYELDPILSDNPKATLGAYIQSEFSPDAAAFVLENRTPIGVDKRLSYKEYQDVVKGLQIYTSLSTSRNGSDGGYASSPRWQNSYKIFDPKPMPLADPPLHFPKRMEKEAITQENPFFDGITGVEVKILPATRSSKNKIRFSINFNQRRRQCYKGVLEQQITKMYVQDSFLEGEGRTTKRDTFEPLISTFEQDDVFEFFTGTKLSASNPINCPRQKIKIEVLNPEVLDPFEITRPPKRYAFSTTRDDYERLFSAGLFQVPTADLAPAGIYTLNVKYTNLSTGEEILHDVSFRINRGRIQGEIKR